jgi:hypothetical protein
VRVQFVDAPEMNIQAVECRAFRRQRLEFRAGGKHMNIVRADLHSEPLAKSR